MSHLSLDDFHRLYDGVKPYHEYWYGQAIPKARASTLHGLLQTVLLTWLFERGWKAAAEVTLKISPDVELIPDGIATRGPVQQPYPTRPVEVCIEILSPDDRLQKALQKGRFYVDWGVSDVWIIDPARRTAWMVTRDNREGIAVPPEGSLTAGEDTQIPLPELFARLNKFLQNTWPR